MKTLKRGIRNLLGYIASAVFILALLFWCAGRWDIPMLWAYSAIFLALTLVGTLTIDPDLMKERLRPGPGSIDRGVTGVLVAVSFGVSYLSHIVVAGLDVGRFHWSDTLPPGLQVAALIVFAVSWAWVNWAMAVNRFFSSVVRIQSERGHQLVSGGPYRYVRHPGYIGAMIGMPASALALGSSWSLLPASILSVLILRRAALEDRYLKEHLDGYKSYAETVRYRLVPGIW